MAEYLMINVERTVDVDILVKVPDDMVHCDIVDAVERFANDHHKGLVWDDSGECCSVWDINPATDKEIAGNKVVLDLTGKE